MQTIVISYPLPARFRISRRHQKRELHPTRLENNPKDNKDNKRKKTAQPVKKECAQEMNI